VGAPFFNQMTIPVCVMLLFLLGVGPALPWRGAKTEYLQRQFTLPFAALVITAIAAVALGTRHVYTILAFAFAAFALVSNVQQYLEGSTARMRAHGENGATALYRLIRSNPRRFGGYLAHIGIITLAVGVTASSAFRTEREATLRAGQTVTLGEYTVRFDQLWAKDEPHRFVVGADIALMDGAEVRDRLQPTMNFYRGTGDPITTPAVRTRAHNDLYLNLLAFERDGSSATLHVIIEPMVVWMWIGGLIVALGAVVAMTPTRVRVRTEEVVAA
jgi:cytochrome c-type biogenesis protein CcmF